MADKNPPAADKTSPTDLTSTDKVVVVPAQGSNVQVQFRIDDLLKRHVENQVLRSVASCSGCNGCSGQRA